MYRYPHILNNAHHLLTNNVQVKMKDPPRPPPDEEGDSEEENDGEQIKFLFLFSC